MSEMSTSGSGGTEQDPRYTEALALYLGGALTREQVFERYPGLRGRLEPLFADEDAVDGGVRNGPAGPAAPNSFSRYRILGRLGQGGMGVVLRAYDTELDREVALKVLRRDRAGQPEQIARMKKEACINARLTHSGIVPIHDAGVMPDGRPFITMKLVEGASLSELLEERKHKLDWHLKVFERICEAVAFAHSLAPPVLHRDLKPGNIRISSTGEVYTVDWGLAQALTASGAAARPASDSARPEGGEPAPAAAPEAPAGSTGPDNSSLEGSPVGTPANMPPEQAKGRLDLIGPASDVFGLGTVLFEILTGERPYRSAAGDVAEVLRLARGAGLPALRQRLEACAADRELKDIALRCLAENPGDRFPNAGALHEAFQAYQQGVRDRLEQEKAARIRSEARRKWQAAAAGILFLALIAGFFTQQRIASAKAERLRRNNQECESIIAQLEDKLVESARDIKSGNFSQLLSRLEAASAARKQAEGLVAGGEVEDSLRHKLVLLGGEIGVTLDQARRQDRLVRELRQASALAGARVADFEIDSTIPSQTFREAFAEYGILQGQQSAETVDSLLSEFPEVLRDEILVGLEYWGLLSPSDAPRIRPVVERIDRDPWRKQLRQALHMADREALIRLAREAAARKLPATSLRILAVALRRHAAPDESVALLRWALLNHRRDFWLQLELGYSLERVFPPRGEEVVASYSTAVTLDESNPLAWMGLGQALGVMGRAAESDECYARALKLVPSSPLISFSRASVHVLRNDCKDLSELKDLCMRHPERADVTALLARLLAANPASTAEGKKLLQSARERDPNSAQIPLSDAFVAMREKRYGDFLAPVQNLRRGSPGDLNLVRTECLGLLVIGNLEEAEQLARQCFEGGHLPALFGRSCAELLSASLLFQGRPDEAETWAKEAMRLRGKAGVQRAGAPEVQLLFEALVHQGKFEEARALPPRSPDNRPGGLPLADALFSAASDPSLAWQIRLRDVLHENRLDQLRLVDQGMSGEVALACGMPRHAYSIYKTNLESFAGQLGGGFPSPLWLNNYFPLSIRFNGARAGVRAGCDAVKEPMVQLPLQYRRDARKQALAWLRTELRSLQRRAGQPAEKSTVNGILCCMQRCRDFSGVRDQAGLTKLPADEREEWEKFWAEAKALRQKVIWTKQ